jgi:SAM-dependent methyltransferase
LSQQSADAEETAARSPRETAPVERDYIERNKNAWEHWAPGHIAAGRRAWLADELRWGLWDKRESELGLLDGFGAGDDAIELGCGTAAISAWLARRGLRPVAVDFSYAQARTVETFQQEFGVSFPLVRGNAEEVPYDFESFDLAISEYGVSVWCDPRRWLSEAHRLLRPEGRLAFFTSSALLLNCTPTTGGPAGDVLVRDYFSRYRVEFEPSGPVEFHLTHGHWIRLLHATGFVLEDLVEVRPDPADEPRFDVVSAEWAQHWPSEEIWIASKRS